MKLASIYDNLEYHDDKPAIQVLMETDFTKEIRIAMKKGQVMKEHQAPYPIVIQIIEGAILFGVEEKSLTLAKGEIIALAGKVPHNLQATENSLIRLTLSKRDLSERVMTVVEP